MKAFMDDASFAMNIDQVPRGDGNADGCGLAPQGCLPGNGFGCSVISSGTPSGNGDMSFIYFNRSNEEADFHEREQEFGVAQMFAPADHTEWIYHEMCKNMMEGVDEA